MGKQKIYYYKNMKHMLKDNEQNKVFPIRTKVNVVRFWLYLLKIISSINYEGNIPNDVPNVGDVVIIKKDKMRRVYFFKDKQIVSLNFPFQVEEKDGVLIPRIQDIEIDGCKISQLLTTINNEKFSENCWDLDLNSLFPECYTEKEYNIDYELWILFKELFFSDDGYIRYDSDETYHPEIPNHIDIFMSDSSSFKICVNKQLDFQLLLDILTTPYNLCRNPNFSNQKK